MLKPDVVFFGENVPKERVELCYSLVDEAEALLVAGSSLTVMSGLRFVRAAHRRGIPVGIVNRGRTRGDELASLRVDAGCSEVLASSRRPDRRATRCTAPPPADWHGASPCRTYWHGTHRAKQGLVHGAHRRRPGVRTAPGS